MNILLFNDNPVVRKLVALSAQKTKDELSIVWTIDEVEESSYDLLIIDDALYSDDTFAGLKEAVAFKSTLLMATRGNSVPAGFDYVINKPFLPTDLVDMFIQIQKKIESIPSKAIEPELPTEVEEDEFSINLEEAFPELESDESSFSDESFGHELNLDDLESFEDDMPLPNILDQEEVQEVRDLLEDTEEDFLDDEEGISVAEIEEISEDSAIGDDESFDFDALALEEESVSKSDESEDLESFNFDDMLESIKEDFADDELLSGIETEEEAFETGETASTAATEEETEEDSLEGLDFDDTLLEMIGLEESSEESVETTVPNEIPDEELMEDELAVDEDDLETLEQQIQNAVDDLEPSDLEMELAAEDLGMDFEEDTFEVSEADSAAIDDLGFDELDSLDERELKMAIGEEVEEEPDIRIGEGAHTSLDVEALGEVTGKAAHVEHTAKQEEAVTLQSGSPEGVEALQALLKALSNEEVAKSLKGLNISININFGNDK